MWQEIVHTLPGPGRVDSAFPAFAVATDHPPRGEEGSRPPTPWALFLASVGACMASFVAARCEELGVPAEGVRLVQRQDLDERDLLPEIAVAIEVPPGFPAEHREALVAAAGECTVKRAVEAGIAFPITIAEAAA